MNPKVNPNQGSTSMEFMFILINHTAQKYSDFYYMGLEHKLLDGTFL